MIAGVDIGGTKTLIALFAENGKLLRELRFETNRNYDEFLIELKKHADTLETTKAKVAVAAVPGLIDRKEGVVRSLGNLPWKDKYIRHDIAQALGIQRVFIENDSKLAGLAEARHLKGTYDRVFYITLSTGIGGALMVNGRLSDDMIDAEIGKTPLLFKGKIRHWEEFASGRYFFNRYKQKAVDVKDEEIWQEFCEGVNAGIGMVCTNYQADAIVFGGGLGQRLTRFRHYITPYLEEHLHPIVKKPVLLATHYRSQSVIYGCYHYAKNNIT